MDQFQASKSPVTKLGTIAAGGFSAVENGGGNAPETQTASVTNCVAF